MIQSDFIEVNGERVPHYYLCHYKPLSSGFDRLSKSLIGFKRGNPIDLEAWTSCAVESISNIISSPLVLRALHADEVAVVRKNSTLDRLGANLATSLRGLYEPEALTKKHVTIPMKQLSKTTREVNLKDIYSFSPPADMSFIGILLIDDIMTTGFTIRAMVKAVRQKNRSIPIVSFTLASTESVNTLNDATAPQSSAYSWRDEVGWKVAEEAPDPLSVHKLKEAIACNFSDPE